LSRDDMRYMEGDFTPQVVTVHVIESITFPKRRKHENTYSASPYESTQREKVGDILKEQPRRREREEQTQKSAGFLRLRLTSGEEAIKGNFFFFNLLVFNIFNITWC